MIFALTTLLALAAPRFATAQVSFQVLHTFPAPAGSAPLLLSSLVQGTDGNFYGTTNLGGAANLGTVYRMTAAGVVSVLHEFAGGNTDGATPLAALIQASDGNFYGTTSAGGPANLGTVFQMSPSGAVTILHPFSGGNADGATPGVALIQATDGNLYGTTQAGGVRNGGTVFQMTPTGGVTILASAPSPKALIQATDGKLYWTAFQTVFSQTLGGASSVFYDFRLPGGGISGTPSLATIVQAADGNFYVAFNYGIQSGGAIWKLTQGGVATQMRGNGRDGTLLRAADGNLYATAGAYPGSQGASVQELTIAGGAATLQSLPEASNLGGLVQAADGTFYGTASGGLTGSGEVFRLTVTPQAPAIVTQPTDQVGWAGGLTSFDVTASGLPPPNYQWQVSTDSGISWTNVTDGDRHRHPGAGRLRRRWDDRCGRVSPLDRHVVHSTVRLADIAFGAMGTRWRCPGAG